MTSLSNFECDVCAGTRRIRLHADNVGAARFCDCPCRTQPNSVRYRFLREIWPGLISQVRFPRDDENAGEVHVVRIGTADNLLVRNNATSFDRAVDAAMEMHREVRDAKDATETLPAP